MMRGEKMSVLIRGMEMLKDCFECVFFDEEHNWCNMQDEHLHNQKDKTGRAKWCPIVEVPTPHGRLIDADEIGEISADPYEERAFQSVIEEMPTIVEAEE